jgi:hypothetical protein
VRGLAPASVERVTGKLSVMLQDQSAMDMANIISTKIENFNKNERVISAYNTYAQQHEDKKTIPFLKLNATRNVYGLKIREINKNEILYFSSCFMRDDIAKIFNIETDVKVNNNISQWNIFTSKRGVEYSKIISNNLDEYIAKHNYKYYIFVLAYDWQGSSLDVLITHLKKIDKIDRLILFIAHSPDYMFYLNPKFMKTNPLDILEKANVFCIFANSTSVFKLLSSTIQNKDITFGNFNEISKTTVDLPNFFHNFYNIEPFSFDSLFSKLIFSKQHSEIVGNHTSLRHIYFAHLIFLALSILIALAGVVTHIVNPRPSRCS